LVLDVASKPCFRKFCQSLPNVKYLSSDLMTEGAMLFSDLTRMGLASNSCDIITCLHVMEHIPDDRAALAEIRRLLKPDGFAVVAVPLRGDETFEDPDAKPEDYERLFGQFDHVRFYGMDIVKRMHAAGLVVETIDILRAFPRETLERHALYGDDRYFFRLSKLS
jgi:SAM-dependent methyltransferase